MNKERRLENFSLQSTKPSSESELKDILISREDYFLLNPPTQPKKEIAEYVESQGILVPRKFEGLEEALEFVKSGGEIIIRSEHPNEYNGASGLLESYTFNKSTLTEGQKVLKEYGNEIDWNAFHKKISYVDVSKPREGHCGWRGKSYRYTPSEDYLFVEKIKSKIFGQIDTLTQEKLEKNLKELSRRKIEKYCELCHLNTEVFINKISYTYREKFNGYIGSIIADSTLQNRYHLFGSIEENGKHHKYYILENNDIDTRGYISSIWGDYHKNIITFYEQIKKLKKFNPIHCPIIEFGINEEGNIYFLQYHRTRDFSPADFTLNRSLEKEEFQVSYVRGSTPPEGITKEFNPNHDTLATEVCFDLNFHSHEDNLVQEVMSKKRNIHLLNSSLKEMFEPTYNSHLIKSKQFNPQLFLCLPEEDIFKAIQSLPEINIPTDIRNLWEMSKFLNNKQRKISIRIISDGKKAYVKIF